MKKRINLRNSQKNRVHFKDQYILKEYQYLINKFKTYCDEQGYVYNHELETMNPFNVRYLFIGIHPSKQDQNQKRYFSHSKSQKDTGYKVRQLSNKLGILFDKEVLTFNMTPIRASNTHRLSQHRIKDSSEYMAKLIYRIWKLLQLNQEIKILIYESGKKLSKRHQSLANNYYIGKYKYFYNTLCSYPLIKDYIYVWKHPHQFDLNTHDIHQKEDFFKLAVSLRQELLPYWW